MTAPSEGYAGSDPNLRNFYVSQGTGMPTIFIHGSAPGASAASNFRGNLPDFAEAGFRAVGIDLFGYGKSSKPEDRNYNLDFQIGGLKTLVDTLGGGPVNLVGNSLGGAVAMRFTLEYPALVAKLVLLAPGGLGTKLRYLRMPGIRAMMWSQLGPGGQSAEKLRGVFNLQLFDKGILTDALIEERLAVAKTQPRRVFTTLKIDNLLPRLAEIRCPTLAFWGVHDNFCPVETAPLLAQGIPDCRVILLSRCGHWAQVEHQNLFNREAIRFLKGEA